MAYIPLNIGISRYVLRAIDTYNLIKELDIKLEAVDNEFISSNTNVNNRMLKSSAVVGNLPKYGDVSGDVIDSGIQVGDIVLNTNIGTTVQAYNINTVIDANYVATANNYTNTDKAKVQSALQVETITSLTLTANVLKYINEAGGINNMDLSLYLDDSNLARIISGTYDIGTNSIIYTRDDGSTFSIDASMFFDDTNLVLSVDGSTGAVNLSSIYEPKDATILKDTDIGVSLQAYNVNTVIDANYIHIDNNFTNLLKTKLDNIENSATADQTDIEIKTAYENNANTNAYTDIDKASIARITNNVNETGAPIYIPDAGVSNHFRYVLTEDTTIGDMININSTDNKVIEITQDIIGGHAISFGVGYNIPAGILDIGQLPYDTLVLLCIPVGNGTVVLMSITDLNVTP